MLPHIQHTRSVHPQGGAIQPPSFRIIQALKRALTDTTLTTTERCVLMHMMLSAGAQGEHVQRHQVTARAIGISERHCKRIMASLDAAGRLHRESRGPMRANRYRMPWGTPMSPKGTPMSPIKEESSSKSKDPQQRHSCRPAADPPKTKPPLISDDEKPPNTEVEARERTRVMVGRNPENNVQHTIASVQKALERFGSYGAWLEYWNRLRCATSAPERLGTGHYVAVANALGKEARAALRLRTASVFVVAETPRCVKCRGWGLVSDSEHCDCAMGRDLARDAKRKAKETK